MPMHNLRKKPKLDGSIKHPDETIMKSILQPVVRFLKAEEGPTAVEYAVLLLLIFLACINTIVLLGHSTAGCFDHSGHEIHSATGGGQ
jgi:pilus assembly protein Flp/PilA